MKQLILTMAVYFAWGALAASLALADTIIVDDKAYTLVEIDGQLLVSNEWEPTTSEGYTDEYLQSDEYKTAKHANQFIATVYGRYDDE